MDRDVYSMKESYCIPPGETLQEWLNENAMEVSELATRLGMTRQSLHRILKGEQPITPKTALSLELVTGLPASFWTNLERDYREALIRKALESEEVRHQAWLKKFPMKELEVRGAIPMSTSTSERLTNLLGFFGVSSADAFDAIWEDRRFAARSTKGAESDREALLSWIQHGTHLAKQVECGAYDSQQFRTALEQIRNQTRNLDSADHERVKVFLKDIKARCVSVGVTVIFLKSLKGMRKENGVAFWIEGGKRPVILMTLNGRQMDRIFFSFFHEAHHILSGQKKLIYVSRGEKTDDECAADDFAAEALIPSSENPAIQATRGNFALLRELADHLGVCFDLVLGRYSHLVGRFCTSHKFSSISWDVIGSWML